MTLAERVIAHTKEHAALMRELGKAAFDGSPELWQGIQVTPAAEMIILSLIRITIEAQTTLENINAMDFARRGGT